MHGGGEQRQPAAGYEQPPPLGEGGAVVEEANDVAGAAADRAEQLGGRGVGVAAGEVGDGQVDCVERDRPDVGCLRAQAQLD